jgi:aconitate hydratase
MTFPEAFFVEEVLGVRYNSFGRKDVMETAEFVKRISLDGKTYQILDINMLEKKGIADIKRLPFAIKILVENLLRKLDGRVVREEDLITIARWETRYGEPSEIPFHPARVLMQDFTGVPAVVDLAAMRDAVKDLGDNPDKINPLVPVDLVVDHSVQVDYYGTKEALGKNVEKEYDRNWERYALLKWAQKSFDNFRVVPPNSGICHQVNLEYLGKVVITAEIEGRVTAYPDTLVGTDSHATMINGIGVMGWGVGGIEAEAVMLGQPYYIPLPEVIGVKMVGELNEGTTATDLVLTITELLRTHKVVEKFVEYFGPGMKNLTVPDRATIANMTPEYGATLGFFPVDEKTVEYLRMTNRQDRAEIVERYTREIGLFYTGETDPEYTEILELDLSTVEPSVAGPARPQDRIALRDLAKNFERLLGSKYERDGDVVDLSRFHDESGHSGSRECAPRPGTKRMHEVNLNGKAARIGDGSIVIGAITSCTNTSNPLVMLGAGLVAKKAVERGLRVPSYVKTSLAPGSRIVINYLEDSGLMPYLEVLGFHPVGLGCTTCIGNSGSLHPEIERAISDHNLSVASVLSGNRNFEARIHQSVRWNFLASPMLVVALAIAGNIGIDLVTEPLAFDPNAQPVYLKDIWPEFKEIEGLVRKHVKQQFFRRAYERIFDGDAFWKSLEVVEGTTYDWDDRSTYIKRPPYFEDFSLELARPCNLKGARALLLLGDSVTTDHISPAGAIPQDYPAGQYLVGKKVAPADFNSYGSRRGNHEVMMRGTFANIRIRNRLSAPKEGGFTVRFPERRDMFIYDAAIQYKDEGTPLVILGGKEYGVGSSRDWAAKGTLLLGIKAVIAESFERIHRSNLVGVGALPLMFKEGDSWERLGLDGSEIFSILGIDSMKPRKVLNVKALKADGTEIDFEVIARLDTEVDVEYHKNGGILQYVLRKMLVQKET